MPPSGALLALGFRPFFTLAAPFAAVAILAWAIIYAHAPTSTPGGLPAMLWHGHEMVYGFAHAAIAGFLLTAVANWTGVGTIRGPALAALAALWLTARLAYLLPSGAALAFGAAADLLFGVGLLVAIAAPVVRVRQWRQLGLLTKVALLPLANALCYAGALGHLPQGTYWGLYAGLYLVLAVLFTVARRIMPFFIERGVPGAFTPRNRRWIDLASLALFLVWALLDILTRQSQLVAWLSVGLVVVHAWRLWDWHTPGIWQRPLLWSLYVGYGFLVLGFLLKALSIWAGIWPSLAVHAFAVGGIGLIAIGMMARVSLAHTGRDPLAPPRILTPIFSLVLLAAVLRVVAPLAWPAHYQLWIGASQVLWIAGFAIFSFRFLPMLARPRIDGRPG
ncbi:NnrS family protein [Thiococcus pfennigii]|jgi:uncharacterized protein involved in response to NO|uniref:NnrS family protein n=1 Tax=Thiococcus pfennigii TaxID=1057 RepID=UPI00190448A9|nr:NnrS family protein [Thiococcus pfennigii]MBK1702713.1 hypothetical protein [Thiococcus pfennigii]